MLDLSRSSKSFASLSVAKRGFPCFSLKNDVSENGKNTVTSFNSNEAMAKKVEVPMKPKSLLKDCDLCQMKFLNDRSLMMHKKTEH